MATAARRWVAGAGTPPGAGASPAVDLAAVCGWAVRLGELHPADPGVICALLLNHVRLRPGEAIALPAGNLHAYLRGVGVEIMGNSDNVLRGGLTPKHVDVPELLRILQTAPTSPEVLTAQPTAGGEEVYVTEFREFRLSRLRLHGPTITLQRRGPQVLLGVEGQVSVRSATGHLRLRPGQSVFVTAAAAPVGLASHGTVFRATPGLPPGPDRPAPRGSAG